MTSARLGKASISGCAFENPDGSPITIATDYFGKPRNAANPTPGPFEAPRDRNTHHEGVAACVNPGNEMNYLKLQTMKHTTMKHPMSAGLAVLVTSLAVQGRTHARI